MKKWHWLLTTQRADDMKRVLYLSLIFLSINSFFNHKFELRIKRMLNQDNKFSYDEMLVTIKNIHGEKEYLEIKTEIETPTKY